MSPCKRNCPKPIQSEKQFSVTADASSCGGIIGRNGYFNLTKVELCSGPSTVKINGIGKRGCNIRGGIWCSHAAMDELATAWLKARGKARGKTRGKPSSNPDDIQTVCQLAKDYLDSEAKNDFEGWDADDIADSLASLKRVRSQTA